MEFTRSTLNESLSQDMNYQDLVNEFCAVLIDDKDGNIQTWQDAVEACAYRINTLNQDDRRLCRDAFDNALLELGAF